MINVGSTSVKFALSGPVGWRAWQVHRQGHSLAELLADARRSSAIGGQSIDAIVHRVVHGGSRRDDADPIDDQLVDELTALVPLAPLHQPATLDAIAQAHRLWPASLPIACYDTAFHRHADAATDRLPLPDELDAIGIRRYGFHGLNLQSIVDRLPARHQVVVAHLGGGCSVSAIADGRSRFTTMSVTPTGGVFSATRSGDLDPDAVLALIDHFGYSTAELRQLINFESGTKALSGGIADHRELIAAARTSARAMAAWEAFVRSIAAAIMAAATTLDRWDGLIFTGGIGERAEPTRQAICRAVARTRGCPVGDHQAASRLLTDHGVRVRAMPAEEERVMDRQARRMLAAAAGASATQQQPSERS